nr:hypothetical protein [Micromonospora sp. DSM 115978]
MSAQALQALPERRRWLWPALGGYAALLVVAAVVSPYAVVALLLPLAAMVGIAFRWDTVSLLSVQIVAMFGVSSLYVVPGFGPLATVVGLSCLLTWV